MIQALRRKTSMYAAIAAMVPKLFLAYSMWVWMEFFVQILAMTIFVYFWRAVYSGTSQIGGLNLDQTINYVLLAQILVPIVQNRVILNFGGMTREGLVGIELLRPLDFENRFYIEQLTTLGITLALKLPLVLIAWLFFGLQLPSDPAIWGVFAVSLLLGHAILFFFDWTFSCLAFYSTETWGLSVVREAVVGFFSGALVPVAMMPLWLQNITQAMPFAQALYVPISFLSGIHTLAEAPRLWLVQIVWLVGLGLLSRLVFILAVRKVTVQGGWMSRYLSLYWQFLLQRFKILMEYRLNFYIGASSTIFLQAAGLTAIWVVMSQIPSLEGWTFDEVLLVYGLLTLAKSISHMFADNLWIIGWGYIRPGNFDRFLVRPIDPLFHLLADRFCHDGLGNFLVGAVLIAKASISLHIPWTPLNLFYLVLMVLSGGLIFIALNLITATSAFWVVESIPVTQIIFNTHEFAKYPLTIYNRGIGILMTWLIPYGFTSFYPANYLLGRDHTWIAWASPAVAAVLMALAYCVWLFGLRHYSGTGS